MSEHGSEPKRSIDMEVRQSVDMQIVGDNIDQIARLTVEKYEFANSITLDADKRADAIRQIEEALWAMVERLRKRRQEILASMFRLASETLEQALKSKD